METVIKKFFENAKSSPDTLAVILEKEKITYGELAECVSGFAHFLTDNGVGKGDCVVVKAIHSVEFTVTCLSCHAVGAIFVPADQTAPNERLEEIAEFVGAKMVISNVYSDIKGSFASIDVSKVMTEAEKHRGEMFTPVAELEAPADIMFTTGTTGNAKGVMLSHRNLTATVLTRMERLDIKKNNVALTAVPINHVAPMRELYLNLYNGSTVCFIDGVMKIKAFFDFLHDYGVTSLYMPPSHVHLILNIAGAELAKYKDQIDYVYIGSAPFDESGKEKLCAVLPNTRLFYSYGSSENGSVSLLEFSRDKGRDSCCGNTCNGVEVKIVNDDFREVAVGEVGLVTIKTEMNMMGYVNRPELNEQVFRGEYFLSNDMGYFDSEGFLYIVGRRDDVINVGGLKLSPTEVEGAARGFEAIEDCICIPRKDTLVGEKPCLLVVIKQGAEFNSKELISYLRGKLENFKIPESVEIVDHIERTANGKLNRKAYKK